MPKKRHHALNDRRIRALSEPGRYADGEGLHLVVSESGAKRWMQRITIRGRRRDIGLGGYPLVSLADARMEALSLRAKARRGEDDGARQASLIMERAAVYEKLGQFDASMQAHLRATEIYEESLGTSHSLYALSIHNHAQSLKNFGRCDLALPKFRRARELQVVLFGEDSEWTRRNDDRIAECESTTAGSEVH